MDDYPAGSLDHNLPLLVVSGLSTGPTKPLLTDPDLKEQSVLIRSELPPVESREAKAILHYIQEADASDLPWNGQDTSRKYKFKVKTLGRVSLRYQASPSWLSVRPILTSPISVGLPFTTEARSTARRPRDALVTTHSTLAFLSLEPRLNLIS
jgi:hypothetical protein